MNSIIRDVNPLKQRILATALVLVVVLINVSLVNAELTDLPPGYHRMPNGDIMANSPSTAVAPPGFRLTDGGILKKLDDDSPDEPVKVSAAATIDDFGGEIPPGYHRMSDGTIMANNPTKAKPPEGYHLMSDGTLMANDSIVDQSAHSHGSGGMWMMEYAYSHMYMGGLLDATTEVTPQEVVDPNGKYRYSMSPTTMTMDMHMLMLMYHTTKYMVMVMGHYMKNDMGMYARDGTTSDMKSSGIGDTKVTVAVPWRRYNLGFTLGMSFPTGSIDERGPMRHSNDLITDEKYPYGMQLGSGTYDAIFGIDYEDTWDKLGWGADYEYTLRNGTNDNEYSLGDKMVLDGWVRWNFTRTFNGSAKLAYLEVGQISGADPELDPDMSPAADAENYGGRRVDLGIELKYETPGMTSVAAEFVTPIYQNLFGPQMKVDWIAGLKFGFMF